MFFPDGIRTGAAKKSRPLFSCPFITTTAITPFHFTPMYVYIVTEVDGQMVIPNTEWNIHSSFIFFGH